MGRAICRRLAAQGHGVAVLDIDGDATEQVAKEIEADGGTRHRPSRSTSATAPPSTPRWTGPRRVRPDRDPRHQRRASRASRTSSTSTSRAWERILAVNLTGTFHCVQSVVPDMVEAGWGRIVTISSSSAQSGTKRMAHYVASKGGVIALTKALALDLAPNGITVNTIPPGAIDTPMMRRPMESGAMASMDQIVGAGAARPAGHARRHRGRVRVPVLGGGGLHHGPADQRQRGVVPLSTLTHRATRDHGRRRGPRRRAVAAAR